jgi:hypothetical protein
MRENITQVKKVLMKEEFIKKREKYLQSFDEFKLWESEIEHTIRKCYDYFDEESGFYEEFTEFENKFLY